jgi:hypothetical protein
LKLKLQQKRIVLFSVTTHSLSPALLLSPSFSTRSLSLNDQRALLLFREPFKQNPRFQCHSHQISHRFSTRLSIWLKRLVYGFQSQSESHVQVDWFNSNYGLLRNGLITRSCLKRTESYNGCRVPFSVRVLSFFLFSFHSKRIKKSTHFRSNRVIYF